MICSNCGKACREGARFCSGCGAALAPRCPACGVECEADARFCDACGAPLAAAAQATADAGARKVVSIIFADLVGSTALHERLDAESARRLMERYYAALRATIESHGGTVVKLLGDGVMAAFGVRQVSEDDALRAVRAAVAMQDAFRALVREQAALAGTVGLRVAVNTGEVVVSGAHDDLIGDPVNVAARLQEKGRDGDVVVGEATSRLVETRVTLEPLGDLALKGRAERVAAYRVASLDPPAGATAAPFVGRGAELARLDAAYDTAVTTPAARLAVLIGSPGLGKSRLIDEFARRHAGGATLLAAHCDAAGGASFAPLASALRARLGVEDAAGPDAVRAIVDSALGSDEADRTRIAGGVTALLMGAPAAPEETFFVVRRFLAALAATRPVLLVIDDLHWAEPLLLDLVEHLVQWGTGVPLFVLVGARPELHGLRAPLGTRGGLVTDVVTLSGLDAGAAMRLAANVIGAVDLPAAVAAKVLATSEGNPLFVGELVRMLVQEGALTRDGDRWTVGANLAELEMPPTIHALLAARIERLRPDERQVLERAAVVGRHFSRSAVAALLGSNRDALDRHLESLRRGELIEPDAGWLLGEPAMRFHHVLIRDAAYRRLLKGTRAELHGRLAEWIEGLVGGAPEHDETIGWHLEQAHQLLTDLGPLDAAGAALGARAATRLAAAGRRALAGDDVPLAAGLLGRAIARLAPDDPARAELALDWCEALLTAGDVARASEAIAELGRFSDKGVGGRGREDKGVGGWGLGVGEDEEAGVAGSATALAAANSSPTPNPVTPNPDPSSPTPNPLSSSPAAARLRAWHTCFAGQLSVLTEPAALQATSESLAAAAAELTALGDAAGEAKAHSVHAQALARLGKVGACEAALDRALAAARRAGDRRRANAVLAGAPVAALWGPSPVTRASGRCLDVVRVLRITQGAPAVEAVALSCQGVLEALRGRTDAARRMLAAARQMVEELGIAHRLHETDAFAGRIAAMEGDTAAAEPLLRGAYEGLRELGLGIDAARAAALLARVLLAQDRAAEAEALSHEGEALAGDDLQAAIAWRGVRAEALAQRGEHAAAIELAQAAVSIAVATDALLDHADARLALAAALRAAGRGADADAEQRRAIELWEAKGATLLAEQVRRDNPRSAAPAGTADGSGSSTDVEDAFIDLRGARILDANAPTGAPTSAPTAGDPRVAPTPVAPFTTSSVPRMRRRVRTNAATRNVERFLAALETGDEAALVATNSAQLETIHHPTGATYGAAEVMRMLRDLRRGRNFRLTQESLATLGDGLALVRRSYTHDGSEVRIGSIGPVEGDYFVLVEVDEREQVTRTEVFADDRLGDAIARLYQRHAELLPEGPQRQAATATADAVTHMLTSWVAPDLTRLFAPDYTDIDHRNVGYGVLSPTEVQQLAQSFRDLAENLRFRVDDVLVLTAQGLVRQTTATGTWRDGGGRFERPVCCMTLFGDDGRATRHETFDGDRTADALARFDALTAGATSAPTVARRVSANAATANAERFAAAIAARDIEALGRELCDEIDCVHHETGTSYGRKGFLATWRSLYRAERMLRRQDAVAGLGHSLALIHHVITLEGFAEAHLAAAGRVDVDEVVLFEVDERGRDRRFDIFSTAKLGHALVRMYKRHAELLPGGPARMRAEHVAAFLAAWNGPLDLARIAAGCHPSLRSADHREGAAWSARDAEQLLRQLGRQLEQTPDATAHYDDILALTDDALLACLTLDGTARDRSDATSQRVCMLVRFGADGQLTDCEWFAADQAAAALARFGAPSGNSIAPPSASFANAASRSLDQEMRYWAAHDWQGLQSLVSPAIRFQDRRRLLHVDVGIEEFTAQQRLLFEQPRSRWVEPMIATRGERLSLHRVLFEAEVAGGGGPLEIENHLVVVEVDAAGRWTALVLFDLTDEAAAWAELERRFDVGEGAAHPGHTAVMRAFAAAVASRDWDPVVRLCAPSFVEYDHRGLAVLGTTRGAAVWVQNFRILTDLAPDTVYRVDHFRSRRNGFCSAGTWIGTRDGGRYEIPLTAIIELDADDRMLRADAYDSEQTELALARFAELARGDTPAPAEARRDRLCIPPNAATALLDRWSACGRTRDWDGLARLYAPAAIFDDRRRLVRLNGDRTQAIASARHILESGRVDFERTTLATAGPRLSLDGWVFRGGKPGADFVVETLTVTEVDADGLGVAWITFDADARTAAAAELFDRYARGTAAALPAATEFLRAINSHHVARVRAALPDNFVFHDHRRTGVGRLAGRDAYLASLTAVWELSPNARVEGLYEIEMAPHGRFGADRLIGSNHEGGEFESVYISIAHVSGGRLAAVELFELEDLDAARARFEALRAAPQPGAALPFTAEHTAMTVIDRWRLGADGGTDWEAMQASLAPGLVFEDRQGFARLSGDRDMLIASLRERVASSARPNSQLMGTAGERVAIVRMLWTGGPADGRFEIEYLSVTVADAAGLVVACILFAADDTRGAQREAWARWADIDPNAGPMTALFGAVVDAANAHDLTRYRALFADDVVVEDHRHGLRMEGLGDYTEKVAMLWEHAPDTRIDGGWSWPALAAHGAVTIVRRVGALADEFVWLFSVAGGRIARIEVFALDALDAARARLAELRPD